MVGERLDSSAQFNSKLARYWAAAYVDDHPHEDWLQNKYPNRHKVLYVPLIASRAAALLSALDLGAKLYRAAVERNTRIMSGSVITR